ncbi:hypothetical protein BS47DRAFT_1388674 [Hydnum rufescens UP504]|uniref:Uncharacterized protein n=1 Tax=Hydnum rufescens UP504 TaxID=1448309 RepID=A0A9P6B7M0_9AGAM|nr:hypothetical protein BS47DRAFT_1388674 [Hydnum rufescens UP504]
MATEPFDVDGDVFHVRLPKKRFGSSVAPVSVHPKIRPSDDPHLVISSRPWCLDYRNETNNTAKVGDPKCPVCTIANGLVYSVKLPSPKTSLPPSIEAALLMVRRIRAPAGSINVSQLSAAEWMERYQREPSMLSEDYRKVLGKLSLHAGASASARVSDLPPEKFRLPLDPDEFDRLVILHRLSPRSEASLRSSQNVVLKQQIRLLKEDFDEALSMGRVVHRRSSIPILDDLLAMAPRNAPAPFDFLPTEVIECSNHSSVATGRKLNRSG